jgi:chromosome segregation ATPase
MSEPIILFWIGALRTMSEPIIYFWLGAIVAALAMFGLRHAARARLDDRATQVSNTTSPTLMNEIGADMEQLHSQIAVATRRLEMSVHEIKLKTSSGLTEIAKTSEAIARLKGELAERTAAYALLQGKERTLAAALLTTEVELTTKSKLLNDVERTLADRRTELARFMADFNVHPEIAKLQEAHAAEIGSLKADKAQVEEQLRQSKEECLKLQYDLNAMGKQVETNWASERMANAVLRERINDVASEVVRVAAALEGLNSPIDAIVAAKLPADHPHSNGVNGHDSFGSIADDGEDARATLVHRVRALHKRAPQLPAPG